MNKDTFRGKANDQWGKMSRDRLDVIAAKRDQLESEIQQVYVIINEIAERQIREFKEINKQ